ncbi:hypothetical protein [uncultured Microbulbifer sp.]|uniref:hypothetical protein n=1 Tax=uncultured Microbulbifer sp. TaxID=348147 RepID=UPI002601B990|nr:hypothetical protein [uncultured Microbulbifer sp.]
MSFWDNLGNVVSKGIDVYEQKELAKLGVAPAVQQPNNGMTGGVGGVPDQSAVGNAQSIGPTTNGQDTGRVTIFGVTMDTGVLQVTALILGLLWFTGKLKP